MKLTISLAISLISLISFKVQAQKEVNFSEDYMNEMNDSVTFEIPEVQELLHIVMAISPYGLQSDEIVDKSTEYYEQVLAHFGPFKEEKIVARVNQQLKRNRYSRLKMDAVGFKFEVDQIVKSEIYPEMNWDDRNWLEPLVSELEEFAKVSSFRQFFSLQKDYYSYELDLLKSQLAVRDQWTWLEERSNSSYQSYRITFSPLTGGTHSTNRFEKGDFRQAVMFIQSGLSKETYEGKYTDKQVEGLMGRIVFTEIDHNYVNPLSEMYEDQINRAFESVEDWNTGKYGYSSPMATFNEYMTHSLYSLYVLDNYSKDDADLIISKHEDLMADRRGFYRYREFNDSLISLYRRNPELNLPELYDQLFLELSK